MILSRRQTTGKGVVVDNHSSTHSYTNLQYVQDRDRSRALKYRLRRRTREVAESLKKHLTHHPEAILDVGSADGRMLHNLSGIFPSSSIVGIEYDETVVKFANELFPAIDIRHGDAQHLEFSDSCFEAAVAAAVIEHLERPDLALAEFFRVLRPGGILVLTCPDPFWEKLASTLGHLKEEGHNEVPDLKRLSAIVQKSGFSILEAKKFMFSPVGFPKELLIESILRALKLNFMMANQLVVARKPAHISNNI